MKKPLFRSALLVPVVALALAGCLSDHSPIGDSHAAAPVQATPAPNRYGLPDFSALVDQVGPAVVNISVTQKIARSDEGDPFADDPFYDFLRRFGVPQQGQPMQPQQRAPQIAQGIGSGFIVSPDGYVLTNAHVVDGATEVTVRLTDKRNFKARVVGTDKRTDVALLKIDAHDLPSVRIGDAERTRVGEWVVAVGSPFGFENTVTAGIVSAKARRLPDETYVPFLQTDVAINPGNSGGPLFNLAGEVVGINSQIYSRSGGFMGISFAIPIDVAMKVKDQLQKYGKVARGRLGVVIQGMDSDLAQNFGLDKPGGALINSVEPGSPAAKAGLQAGDVVLGVNGQRVENSADLPRIIGDQKPGQAVKLSIWRDRHNREVNVTLGAQEQERLAQSDAPRKSESAGTKLGIAARPLSSQEASSLGIAGGLLVEMATGPAAQAGVQPGDIVLALNNQPITGIDQFRHLMDSAGNRFALLLQRGGNRIYVPIRLG